MSACFVEVTESYAVSDFEGGNSRANLFDCANPLVAQHYISMTVVLVSATDTRVGEMHQDLIWSNSPSSCSFDDTTALRAFVNSEFGFHCEISFSDEELLMLILSELSLYNP